MYVGLLYSCATRNSLWLWVIKFLLGDLMAFVILAGIQAS